MGASPTRDQYQFELLKLALEKTRNTYGDYQLIRVDQKITSLRASREVSRGNLINIEATPNWTTDTVPSEIKRDKRIAVKIPILHGLLGYRRLVIRKNDLEKFNAITQESQLQKLVAGQGKDWEDVFIYRSNGYQVNDEADYYKLFAMLAAGRIDYIPLSTIEVENFIQKFGKYSQDVTVAPGILIYYPFPVLFQVSIRYPELAQRVEKGLIKAKSDGSMDKLFQSYFAHELTKLRSANNRVFVLDNKRVPTELRLAKPDLL
ncbi:type 2 periplasmic-binding domain-containing protein [Cellvibrio mixtus]|uniref:transporter substrate-binding domain-containing protein n=1 Tax=Cellvibrio mixtus TaxID=39650 RepID=UPI000587CDC1|nr:transporter substrate-binding domain-containing protein [Cellvibrio mixtus]